MLKDGAQLHVILERGSNGPITRSHDRQIMKELWAQSKKEEITEEDDQKNDSASSILAQKNDSEEKVHLK